MVCFLCFATPMFACSQSFILSKMQTMNDMYVSKLKNAIIGEDLYYMRQWAHEYSSLARKCYNEIPSGHSAEATFLASEERFDRAVEIIDDIFLTFGTSIYEISQMDEEDSFGDFLIMIIGLGFGLAQLEGEMNAFQLNFENGIELISDAYDRL